MMEIKLLPESEIEITGEISASDFMACQEDAIKEFSDIEKAGEPALLEKIALVALQKEYPKIISRYKIKAIGRPEIFITKIAKDNPLGFKIKTAVLPEIDLPDYKKIAKEFKGALEDARKRRLQILDKISEGAKIKIPKILIGPEPEGLKNARYNLILYEIADREKIDVSEEELKKETDKILEAHKDLDPIQVKIYTYGIIRNEKIFQFLESC